VIELEGRMIAGLDEFMLRLGHLKVLCAVAVEIGGSGFRVNREAAKVLTRQVVVPDDAIAPVADYLHRKRLCPFQQVNNGKNTSKKSGKYRYPNLVIKADDKGLQIISSDGQPEIWWQDLCLASPNIASRVGAVTIAAKAESKTGLSHISDWAQFVGLISRGGEASPMGRLIVKLQPGIIDEQCQSNPYIIGLERIAFAFAIIGADIDCFSRLAPKLLYSNSPIRKAEGMQIFAATVQDIAQELREARYLSIGRKRKLYENIRDLENAARRGNRDLGSTSTAWHRASSRLETYVDIGLLEKGRGGEEERFEYVYYPTGALKRAVQSLEKAENGSDWLERYLASTLFGEEFSELSLGQSELLMDLPGIISALARPTAPLPIDAVAIGLVWRGAERGALISISDARKAIEYLALSRPEIARLSRGGFGERAEFISFDIRKLEELTA
jgi:hypothetical protein